MKKLNLFLLFLLLTAITAFSQNPNVVNGVATYTASKNIGRKFSIPNEWTKIIIKANVTLTGSFYMPTRTTPIEIMGENRKTSIIQGDGSRPTDDGINGRSYSAIRADKSPDVYVHDLTVTKPMKFHIHGGFGNVTAERCDIIAGSDTHTTDGIHGGAGKTVIKDCYIDVYDDALYTIECKLVENTTIVHNKNGGPFMTSWGASVPENHTCIVRNCTVIENSNIGYNHGVFSWSQKHEDYAQTIHIKIEGSLAIKVNPGKQEAPMYTIGRPNDFTGLKNATMKIDGKCLKTESVDIRENESSNKVVFVNCGTTSTPVETSIKAFPVPTTGILYLPEVYANDQISVVSVQTGTTVLTKKITSTGSSQLDITNQPAGNYIIQIIRNNQVLTRQIIKQ